MAPLQQIIRKEDEQIMIYDVPTSQIKSYYSFQKEFDEYSHVLDSIQTDVELRYGTPELL